MQAGKLNACPAALGEVTAGGCRGSAEARIGWNWAVAGSVGHRWRQQCEQKGQAEAGAG